MMFALACATAAAQTYPTKPVRLVSPFSAGGGTDLIGRVLAQEMSGVLGQTMLVDNRTGAGVMAGGSATPEEARAFLLSEIRRYRKLVKAIGLKLQ